MHPVRHIPRYTYSDYLLWEGDWEMIEGIPYAMSPAPVQRHQWFSLMLASRILSQIITNKEECGDCRVLQDVDWKIDESTVLRPDIVIVCHDKGDFLTTTPILIVEIISPSSGHKDRIIKHEIYEEQGVEYYIIADPASSSYTTYHLENGKYKEYDLDTFAIHEGCAITLNISSVLAEVKD